MGMRGGLGEQWGNKGTYVINKENKKEIKN